MTFFRLTFRMSQQAAFEFASTPACVLFMSSSLQFYLKSNHGRNGTASKLLRWYLLFQHLLIYPRASIPVRVLHTSSRPSLGCCLSTIGDNKAMNKEKRMTVSDCTEECFPPSRVRALSFSIRHEVLS